MVDTFPAHQSPPAPTNTETLPTGRRPRLPERRKAWASNVGEQRRLQGGLTEFKRTGTSRPSRNHVGIQS